jgi:hypothetical protein
MDEKLSKPVLVLNKNWTAIDTTPLYRAFNLILSTDSKGSPKANIIDVNCIPYTWHEWTQIRPDNDEEGIKTVSFVFKIPEVIKLNKYEKMPKQQIIF